MSFTTVIYNGPSRTPFIGTQFPGRAIGCNWAFRDFDLTDCVAIDRMTVAAIRGYLETHPASCQFWTKETSLELPPGWQHRSAPGIDSGSLAVALALDISPDPIVIIGADGVMGGDHSTAYEYRWHPRGPSESIHLRHRATLQQLSQQNPGRITIAWDHLDNDFVTMPIAQVLDHIHKYKTLWPNQ